MNKIIFVDKYGNQSEIFVSDFCAVTIKVQNGKVVHAERKESIEMK